MINSLYPCFQHWSRTGSVYLYSDPHFGDKDMIEYFFHISDEEQVASINKVVTKNDTLIILGDVGTRKSYKNCLPQIRAGYKVLITGNHDKGNANYISYFDEIYNGPLVIAQKIILSHEPIFGMEDYMLNIHGHLHTDHSIDSSHFCVSSEYINYTPESLQKIINDGFMDMRTIHQVTIDNITGNRPDIDNFKKL